MGGDGDTFMSGQFLNWVELAWSLDKDHRNFGDLLLRESAGQIFSFSKLIGHGFSGAMFGGSCLSQDWFNLFNHNFRNSKVLLWGCGIRDNHPIDPSSTAVQIAGVRGELSQAHIENSFAIGDPGLIAPLALNIKFQTKESLLNYNFPHFSTSLNHVISHQDSENIINPQIPIGKSTRETLKKIANADFVFTGTLHGAVAAYALGTPFWFSVDLDSSAITKYEDFLSMLGIPFEPVADIEEGKAKYISYYDEINPIEVKTFTKLFDPVEQFLVKNEKYSISALNKFCEELRVVRKIKLRNISSS